MTPSEKIAEAKRLLIEATQEMRRDAKRATDRNCCQCGHRRDRHTVSCSVNYTQGFCMTDGCSCKWFMLRDA